MLINDFLENVCKEIKYKPIRNDIKEELNLHVQELKEEFISEGLSETQAEEKAVLNMGDSSVIGKKLNRIHRPKLDWVLLLLVSILIGFGLLVTASKVLITDEITYLYKELKFIILGIILSVVIYFCNYKKILKYSNFIYCCSSILLIISLIFGRKVNGSMHYYLFGTNINPLYISSYCYIISFVGFLINYKKEENFEFNILKINLKINTNLVKIIVLSIISIGLLLNISTAMTLVLGISYVIISSVYIVSSKEKIKEKLFKLYGIVLICVLFMFLIQPCIFDRSQNCLNYMFVRIQNWLNYNDDPGGFGYVNVNIDKTLKNANLYGKAEGKNLEIAQFFDVGTNYALISIVSNYGTIVTGILIFTIVALCVKLIISSKKVKDKYGKFLIIGLSSIILLQAILNILMNFNLLLGIDISLPFVSYGGNGLLINMVSIAFILSIYRRKDIISKDEKYKKLKIKIFYE